MQWWTQKIQGGVEVAFTALVGGETLEDACREYIRQCEEKRAKMVKWYVHFAGGKICNVNTLGRCYGEYMVRVVEAETIEEAIAKAKSGGKDVLEK